MRRDCCKGCQGNVLRSLQRFGRLGKRSWNDSGSADVAEDPTASMKVSVRTCSAHSMHSYTEGCLLTPSKEAPALAGALAGQPSSAIAWDSAVRTSALHLLAPT